MTEAPSPVIDTKPTDDKARPKGFARVLGFFDTATKAIVTITGLVVAIGGAWAAIHHFGSSDDGGSTDPGRDSTAQVQACEKAHGLTQQHQPVKLSVGADPFDGFATCAWPAPGYADADGYSVISFTTKPLDAPEFSGRQRFRPLHRPVQDVRAALRLQAQGDVAAPGPGDGDGRHDHPDGRARPALHRGEGDDPGPNANQVDFVHNDNMRHSPTPSCGS